jgi:hypothetical protein
MVAEMIKVNGVEYNARHGGPFDRGSADSWYSREREPHYYVGDTGMSTRLEEVDMSPKEVVDYNAGYDHNEQSGGKKSYD